jgi:transcriptional regulator with XRE-family HTH domain
MAPSFQLEPSSLFAADASGSRGLQASGCGSRRPPLLRPAPELARLQLARQIARIRGRADLTEAALAERIGTHQTGVARMERNAYRAEMVATLAKIAAATGCDARRPPHPWPAGRRPSVPHRPPQVRFVARSSQAHGAPSAQGVRQFGPEPAQPKNRSLLSPTAFLSDRIGMPLAPCYRFTSPRRGAPDRVTGAAIRSPS